MLLEAAKEFGIDLGRSYLVGDSWSDIAAGRRAGVGTILVSTAGSYDDYIQSPEGSRWKPDYVCAGLPEAVEVILSNFLNGS